MSLKTALGSFAALALLAGCATSTPYQEAADGRWGFNQQQIEQDRWNVTFAGNSLTDRETVETYLLFRAAELTQQQGYDYFSVVEKDTNKDRRVYASPNAFYDPFYSSFARYRFYGRHGRLSPIGFSRGFGTSFRGSRFGYRGHSGFGRSSFDYREVTRYDATAEIIMGRGPAPDDTSSYDAGQVLNNLAGRIERPEV